jgi:hypothetical protein
MLHLREKFENLSFRKESSRFRFTLIRHYVLTNLQFALKFGCPFVIREGASCSNEVENLIVVIIVICVTPMRKLVECNVFAGRDHGQGRKVWGLLITSKQGGCILLNAF